MVTLTTSKNKSRDKSVTGEYVRDVTARRLLEPKNGNMYLADDGNSIVREFVVELDDYSDEDIKEHDLIRGTHE